jgi:hypothetical protein
VVRATIELPDHLHHDAKALAKTLGITLGQFVSEAMQDKLRRRADFNPRGASAPPRSKRG